MTETPKESIKNDGKNDQEDYIAPSLSLTDRMKDKLEDASKKYPIWNPKTKGEVVGGEVDNVEFLEHLNSEKGGYIVRITNADNEKFVTFPNVVMLKKMLNLCPSGELPELQGKKILIQYVDEKQPLDSRLKPYKTYEVIEDN